MHKILHVLLQAEKFGNSFVLEKLLSEETQSKILQAVRSNKNKRLIVVKYFNIIAGCCGAVVASS